MSTLSQSPLSPLSSTSSVSPLKKKAMSITQTYSLAHTARGKLANEASRQDHRLRMLVGHANLLDGLMLELSAAESEQEKWFNDTVKKATKSEDRRVQWADQVKMDVEEPEEDWQAEDAAAELSDSDSESDDEEYWELAEIAEVTSLQLTRVPSHHENVKVEEINLDYEEEEEQDLSLHRVPSRSASSPPELDSDTESDEDIDMPPSPPNTSLPIFHVTKEQLATSFYPRPEDSLPEPQAFFEPLIPDQSMSTMISVY